MFINDKLGRLGKQSPKFDKRRLKLSDFLKPKSKVNLPPIPAETSWITKLKAAEPIPMYLNDTLGICVGAAAGHMIQQWNFYAGHPWQPTDADILKSYEDVGGYVPGDPTTDNGMVIADFLKYWQKTGVGGHHILAYMSVDFMNADEMQLAVQLFGNVLTGIQLPVNVQGANLWTVADGGMYAPDGQPGGWGGHAIPIVAGSPITKTCETWGNTLKMSNRFFKDYVDETWAVLAMDWVETQNISPSLLDLPLLKAALGQLGISTHSM